MPRRKTVAAELEEWKLRLTAAQRSTKRMRLEWWRYFLLYLEGDWLNRSEAGDRNRDHIAVNLAFSHVKTMMPRLFFKKPKVFTPPLNPEDEPGSASASAYLNYLWQALPLKMETKRCVIDALIFGIGFMKHGWHSRDLRDWDELTEKAQEFETEALETQQEIEGFRALEIPPNAVENATPPEAVRNQRDQRIDYDGSFNPQLPWSRRISPFDVFVDPLGNEEHNIRWMAFRYVMSLEDAKDNDLWDKTARGQLQAQRTSFGFGDNRGNTFDGLEADGQQAFLQALRVGNPFNLINSPIDEKFMSEALMDSMKKPEMSQVEIFEVWDKKTNEVWVVNENAQKPLKRMPNPLTSLKGQFPVSILKFNEVPDSFWPMSDMRPLEDQILEMAELRTQALEHVKRTTNIKVGMKKGALDEEAVRALESPDMARVVEVNDLSEPVGNSITPFNLGRLDPNIYSINGLLKNDFDEISGLSEQQRGLSSSSGTATESAITERNANLRLDERQDQVLDFLEDSTSKVFKISTQFVLPGFHVRLLGKKGFQWVPITSVAMNPEREIKIEVGSTLRKDDQVTKRRVIEALNVLTPFIVNGLAKVDINEILRQYLNALEIFTDVEAILNPTQGTVEEQLALLQATRGAGATQDSNVGTNQAANAGQAGDEELAGLADLLGGVGVAGQGAGNFGGV